MYDVMRGSAAGGSRRSNACRSLHWKKSLASERPGLGGLLVQLLPAWTSYLSFASDFQVEKVMLALKDCEEDQDRVLDWSS